MENVRTPLQDESGRSQPATCPEVDVSSLHVAFLTNMIPPHMAPVLREVQRRCRRLTVLVSTTMESDRDWQADWDALEVVIQKTFTRTFRVKHRDGFTQEYLTHFSLDTVGQLRRLNPDVVVSGDLGTRSILAAVYARLVGRKTFVLSCGLSEHTERNVGWSRTQVRKVLARTADHLCSTGTSGVCYLQKLGPRAEDISVSPYARVPMFEFPGTKDLRAPGPMRLLYVGRLIELKGVVPFAQGLAQWATAHPDVPIEFWIAGEGVERHALERLTLPATLSMKLFGSLTFEPLREVYAQCDVLVLPTLTDEWALVVDEALAAGLPVMGSIYAQAVTDLVRHDHNGWCYDPQDAAQLQHTLTAVLETSSARLARMSEAAKRSVAHRTPAFAASRLLDAVECAVRRHTSRR